MAAIKYEDIRDDLKYVADTLEENGFNYKAYNGGLQYNAKDVRGVTQEFYPTTGTIRVHLRDGWGEKIPRPIHIYASNLTEFIRVLRLSAKEVKEMFQ